MKYLTQLNSVILIDVICLLYSGNWTGLNCLLMRFELSILYNTNKLQPFLLFIEWLYLEVEIKPKSENG